MTGRSAASEAMRSRTATQLARIFAEVVHHSYEFPRYARSGWWAGVPHQGAAGK